MNSESKIKVFISSRCSTDRINIEKVLNNDPINKNLVVNKYLLMNYKIVRKALKLALEETGLFSVYLFEDDGPSSFTAEEDYLSNLDDCDVCLFIIDNYDDKISDGIMKEINRAKENQKKSLYIFFNNEDYEITSLEASMKKGSLPHHKPVTSFEEVFSDSYKSVINDIVRTYRRNQSIGINSPRSGDGEDELTIKAFPITLQQTNVEIFKELEGTKSLLSKLLSNETVEGTVTSSLDKWSMSILKVLLGEYEYSTIKQEKLLKDLQPIQSEEIHAIVIKRWAAINKFFDGDINSAIEILEDLSQSQSFNNSDTNWIKSDILIDLGNLRSIVNREKDIIMDFSITKKFDELSSIVFFPLIDRFNSNIKEKILNQIFSEKTDSKSTIHFYNNNSFVAYLTNYLSTAIYYGSYSHLFLFLDNLLEILFYSMDSNSPLVEKLQLLRISILSGNEEKFQRIYSKYKNCLSYATKDEIIHLFKLTDHIPYHFQKQVWKIILIKEIGYYLSDDDFSSSLNEIFIMAEQKLLDGNINYNLFAKLLEMIAANRFRIPQDQILEFLLKLLQTKHERLHIEAIKLLTKLNYKEVSLPLVRDLVQNISTICDSKELLINGSNIQIVMLRISKQRKEFYKETKEIVVKYFPEYFKNDWDLEHFSKSRMRHINRYLDIIIARNATQGINGKFTIFVDEPFYILHNIISRHNSPLDSNINAKIGEAITSTLFSSTQTYSEKIKAIQLLQLILKRKHEDSLFWSEIYEKCIINEPRIFEGADSFLERDTLILLKLQVELLKTLNHVDCFQELVELLSLISNGTNFEIMKSLLLIEDAFNGTHGRNLDISILSTLIQFTSAFCFYEDQDIRFNAVNVLYVLLDSPFSGLIINRLLKMMDDESFEVRYSVLKQAPRIKMFNTRDFEFIISKAKVDNHFLIQDLAKDIKKSTDN